MRDDGKGSLFGRKVNLRTVQKGRVKGGREGGRKHITLSSFIY